MSDIGDVTICFPDGTECKVESYSFLESFEIPESEMIYYKGIKLNNYDISFEGKVIDCDYKALRRVFKIKYPRKLKKKIFGAKRQRKVCWA